MSEASPACVVCERTGVWALALRVAVERRRIAPLRIVETRSPAAARERLAEFSRSGLEGALVVEVAAANAAPVGGLLGDVSRRSRYAPLWGVAEPADAAYEWIVREAGATGFVASRRDLGPLVEALAAYVADVVSRPNAEVDEPIETRIRRRLPWSAARAEENGGAGANGGGEA